MHVIRNNRLEEVGDDDPDVDFVLESPAKHWSTHINMIPLQSAVQSPRLFYGARFVNQALSLEKGEAPLVQNLDPNDKEGRSFDQILGNQMGIQRGKRPGTVLKVTPDSIRVRHDDDGSEEEHELYRDQAFNQKSGINSRVLVKPGDKFTKGQMLAATNYTDDEGTVNMGLNARVGLVPWNGHTMDDAIALSESFANRFKATQYKVMKQDSSDNLKADLNHFRSLFPSRFPKETLENFDPNGLVKPGTVLKSGDPVLLATMPQTLSSTGANVGKLSKVLQQSRRDASMVWEGHGEATVIDSRMTKNGYKVVLRYSKALAEGDKVTFRQGGKGTVAKVIPNDRMPRTLDGQALDVMLNPLSLVSRANPATAHELRLGKVARALGKPIKVPSYLPKGQSWDAFIRQQEEAAGVQAMERIFDPETNRELANPIAVGYGFLNRLHHTSESKGSARGVAGYDGNEQPLRGGHSEGAQAKRFSGLENAAAMSAGAYALMRENSTLRGQRNDEYWRALRAGRSTPALGTPFVMHKFRALLSGAGINTRDVGKGRVRLAPFTDRDLDGHDPVDVENGNIVDTKTLSPIKGGLFDPRIVTGEKWGRIRLPRPVPNPAYSEAIRVMLGITQKEMDAVLRGEAELPPKLRERLGLDKPQE
jgi:DNA-directed RNA polymerase beta subunit